jgi:curved DNA-binding protein CbpA
MFPGVDEREEGLPVRGGRKYRNQEERTEGYNRRWERSGDEYITAMVGEIGHKWRQILEGLLDQKINHYNDPKQVEDRYKRMLDPALKKGPLTPGESVAVLEHVRQHGEENWSGLGEALGRSPRCVEKHWKRVLKPKHPEIAPEGAREEGALLKGRFTDEEDARIAAYVNEFGDDDWLELANELGRAPRAVKERYLRVHGPAPRAWTVEEDLFIVERAREIGKCWTRIARDLDRKWQEVRARFQAVLEPALAVEGDTFMEG